MDLMVANESIYAVQRKQCRSDLLVDFINQIGNGGGFEKMLDMIPSVDLNLLSMYVNCLGKCG